MSLEGEAPSLRGLLETERECAGRLLAILDAERAAAAAYDHAALLACLKEREGIQAAWQRAAQLRRQRVRAAGVSLASLVGDDPSLAAAADAARTMAADVRRAQRVNEGIIRAVLAQVTDLLSVIARKSPDSRYDGRAVLTTPLKASGTSWSA